MALRFQAVINKWLEQFESHLLRQTALVQLQLRTDDDHRTSRIVHALSQQVLAEAALLALERVGKRFQRTVIGAAQHAAAAAIVKQRVNGFLKHALFVAHDHFRSPQLHQLLQTVVAVDDATIKIVKIGRGEAAAIERHQRAQLRRKNRKHIQNHPFRLVAALAERLQNLQALGELDALLEAGIRLHFLAKFFGELVDFHALQKFLDGFRAHLRAELPGKVFLQFAVFFFGEHFAFLDPRNVARINDHVTFEIKNALEIAHGNVQQVADARRQSLEEPDVRAWAGQINMAQAFAAHLGLGDFHAALVADHSAMLHALVLCRTGIPNR